MNLCSMTGFCSVEGTVSGRRLRVEMRSLNHRGLDVKARLPREYASHEIAVRALVQSKMSRGAVDLKVERAADESATTVDVSADLALARSYYEAMQSIRSALAIEAPVQLSDVTSCPNVLRAGSEVTESTDAQAELETLVRRAVDELISMRKHEGASLARTLIDTLTVLDATVARLRDRRMECQAAYSAKITERVRGVFEAYPTSLTSVQAVLESRVAQELALILDRTDIEEELVRFSGHLTHFRKILNEGGPVGRKLDFVIQELHREINTLGNKAQDLPISEDVVQTKVRLEQLREQVMNLE